MFWVAKNNIYSTVCAGSSCFAWNDWLCLIAGFQQPSQPAAWRTMAKKRIQQQLTLSLVYKGLKDNDSRLSPPLTAQFSSPIVSLHHPQGSYWEEEILIDTRGGWRQPHTELELQQGSTAFGCMRTRLLSSLVCTKSGYCEYNSTCKRKRWESGVCWLNIWIF